MKQTQSDFGIRLRNFMQSQPRYASDIAWFLKQEIAKVCAELETFARDQAIMQAPTIVDKLAEIKQRYGVTDAKTKE